MRVCGAMCANTHSATRATARLRACPATRSREAPPAEYTTVRPSATVSASAAMSGPSMRSTSLSQRRLIMVIPFRLGHERGLLVAFLAEQVIVEDLARDRRGGSGAAAAVLDEQRHRELGVVGRG